MGHSSLSLVAWLSPLRYHQSMTLFLTRSRRQTKDGKRYPFWVLRENSWDSNTKSVRQQYVAYVGIRPELTLSKARRICEEKGLSLEDLRAVKGLTIIEDAQGDD